MFISTRTLHTQKKPPVKKMQNRLGGRARHAAMPAMSRMLLPWASHVHLLHQAPEPASLIIQTGGGDPASGRKVTSLAIGVAKLGRETWVLFP